MAPADKALFRVNGDQTLLTGTECTGCGLRWFPPVEFGCERCGAHGEELRHRDLAGSGEIYSFTSLPAREGMSLTLALIVLDDGPAVRALLEPESAERAKVGARVHAVATGGEQPRILFQVS